MTGGGDQPAETRRKLWGWFGPPWPSGVCYDDDGQLRAGMRKPFPAGESCTVCGHVFDEAAGDRGQAIPEVGGPIRHVHIECLTWSVLGPAGTPADRLTGPVREQALAAWAWIQSTGRNVAGPGGISC